MFVPIASELEALLTQRAEAAGLSVAAYLERIIRNDICWEQPKTVETAPEPDGEFEELRESVI